MEIPKLYIEEYTGKVFPTEYLICYEEEGDRMIRVLSTIEWNLTISDEVCKQYSHLEFKKHLEIGIRKGILSHGHQLATEKQFLFFLDRVRLQCLGNTLDTLFLFYGGPNGDT